MCKRARGVVNTARWLGSIVGVVLSLTTPAASRLHAQTFQIHPTNPAGVVISQTDSLLRHRFRIVATGQTPVANLRIHVAPLLGPPEGNVAVRWRVAGRPGDTAVVTTIKPQEAVEVEIAASLPRPGTYTSYISASAGGSPPTVTPLVVTRQLAPPAEILLAEAVRTTSWHDPSIRLTLLDTTNQGLIVRKPALLVLTRTGDNQSRTQARYDSVQVRVEGAGAPPGRADTRPAAPADTLMLEPNQARRVTMTFPGLSEAGQYSGTILLGARDGLSARKDVTLFVKKSMGIAFFFIFLGVLTSWLLRNYMTSGRPRLVRRRNVALLLRRLGELEGGFSDPSQDERSGLRTLRARLEQMMMDLEIGIDVEDTSVTAMDSKLDAMDDWLELRGPLATRPELLARFVNAILPYLRKFPLEKADTDGFDAEVKAIRDALRQQDRAFAGRAAARAGSREGRTPVSEIVRKLQLSDWIFDLVVLLIASVLGISLLWLTDATWGGVEDYIPAFLWGLGLHVVSGSLFESLPGLRKRLVG